MYFGRGDRMDARKTSLGLLVAVVAGLPFAGLGCSKAPGDGWDEAGGPPRVLVSFPALYCFTKTVAGDDAGVQCLMTGVGPHDFQPSGGDVRKFTRADLFLINGLELEPHNLAEGMKLNSGNRKVPVVAIAEEVMKAHPDRRLKMAEHDHADGHQHHHGEFDPHVWLGIPEAVLMVRRIAEELKRIDPAHGSGYERRAAGYIQELEKLQADGKKALEGMKNRKIIATHESLAYFARCFGVEIAGAIQPRPGVEPDAATVARLTDLCRKEQVHVIAVEPQYLAGAAEALAREVRARGVAVELVEVDPLETAPAAELDAGYYVRRMKANLDNLAKHLR
jgi:ABC-type Zn uptake system ZnuABC Zn-binding protein ZnuA